MKKFLILITFLLFALGVGLAGCDKPEPEKYTVTFMNGTVTYDTQSVEKGNEATRPATNPLKTNYAFDNWYEALNADGTGSGAAFVFTTKITKNITLYAAFTKSEKYTVTFMNGTTTYDTQSVEKDKEATRPATNPSKTNYDFDNWYEALKADGTGSGTAFVFTTKITKNTTLYAAFTENQSVTVSVYDCFSNIIYPQKAYVGSGFTPFAYGMDAFDYGDYQVASLEEDTSGFTLTAKYAFLDIKTLAGSNFVKYKFYTEYRYYDNQNNLSYSLKVFDGGYSILNVYDFDCYVSYYKYEQVIVTVAELSGKTYVIITNKGVSKTYIFTGFEDIGGSITLNADFVDTYCKNGVLALFTNTYAVKADSIEVNVDFDNKYNKFAIKQGERVDLSVYEMTGYTAKATYYNFTEAPFTLPSMELFSAASIEKYKSYMEDTYKVVYLNKNFEAADDGNFYYCIEGFRGLFFVEIHLDTNSEGNYEYTLIIYDGKIEFIDVTIYDGEYAGSLCTLLWDDEAKIYVPVLAEMLEFTGTIPASQFAICKKFNQPFSILINYFKTLELDTECLIEEECNYVFTVNESGIYKMTLDNVNGANEITIYTDAAMLNELGNIYNIDVLEFILLAGETYYLKCEFVSSYRFILTKTNKPLTEIVLGTSYNINVDSTDGFTNFYFIPDESGEYTFTTTVASDSILCYLGVSVYPSFVAPLLRIIFNEISITLTLTKGTIYYIGANGNAGASFSFTLTK